MPWNRDKILAEIDRARVPKGVEGALLDRPELGLESLCYALEHGGSPRQLSNALWLIPRLINKRVVTSQLVDLALSQIRGHTTSAEDQVAHAACRAAIMYCFLSTAYPHLGLGGEGRKLLLDHALACRPELDDECASLIRSIRSRPEDGLSEPEC